ncbi:hypothetical protein CXG81DRAFT_14581 [Caulochytrium protostelioides]|uniref:methionine--tRNA ligase n=1 Tax=Caulochytrium protostelioides TaxID=1555241 RepID=A0A4P9X311_9FUNG|nr:hypothetical protein CXG81DRAFT_14581 [Caulochytrium protostelioides]|eukprot:RKO99392.1 hypothetical protein CXG81DRAFT_14581 [Caulochytrium protostelioides]
MPAGRSSARAAQAVPTPLRAWCAAVQQHPQVTPALTQYAALSTTTAGTATATAAAAAKPRRELPPYEFKTPFATSGEVLPDPNSDRNVLITSALPYVNNVPHLGNIIGSTLSADAYARFSRLRNRPTLYVCGTDEYGTATETKALQDGTTCQALCDKYHRLHAGVYQWFNISFDTFGRTTTPHQTAIVQDIFKKLDARGHIQAKDMTQLYCETHKSFLADRFVGGTCPHCKSNDAKGDQCDGCGKLLNAVELIDPKCSVCTGKNSQLPPGTVVPPPILRDSAHLFLNLTQAEEEVTKWIRHSSVKGGWSTNSIQITENWLKEGLKPRCITRDLSWGVPVPEDTRPGFEKKVFYVWFDAPIGYPSITAGYTAQWEKWWKDPEHVQLYQFMGKDNVPFHTVLFPSSLLGTGENWTMLHHLSTTDYLQFEGSKFSKSRGVGVFGDTVMTSGVPPDVWRYFLLSNRPETGDSNFTWAAFALANNSELLANLGNFVNRVMRFVDAKYDGVVPPCTPAEPEHQLAAQVDDLVRQYVNDLEHVKIRSGIETAMRVSAAGNAYLQHVGMDGKLLANHRERCDTVVATALNLAHLIASLVFPYLPNTAEAICRQLNVPLSNALATWPQTPRDTAEPPHPFPQALAAGHVLREPEYLFTRIDTEKLDYLMKTFGSASDAQALIASDAKASKKRPTSAAAAAKGGKAAAAEQGPRTPEVEQAEKAVADQGLKVRQLKAEKADKSAIDAEVKTLLALKKALAETIAAASA